MTTPARPHVRRSRPFLASALLLGLSALVPAGCGPSGTPPEGEAGSSPAATAPTEDHAREIDTWREERRRSLLSEDGWLSLVGLHWLEPGTNTFGSGEGADLVSPAGTPERIGTFRLRDGEVTLEPAPGSGLRVTGGEAMTEPILLVPDTAGEPTTLELGTLAFHVIERGGRYGVRVKDRESSALVGFQGLEYFPVDPSWRVEARLVPEEGATVAVPNVLGQVEDLRTPGTLVFRAPGGEELRLVPTQEEPGDDLFLVFGDATNGESTYGGGRFLYADPPAGDGRVVLDFNRAYNPPCAFTPYATCPLPPGVNELRVAIEAGEKSYAGEIPH